MDKSNSVFHKIFRHKYLREPVNKIKMSNTTNSKQFETLKVAMEKNVDIARSLTQGKEVVRFWKRLEEELNSFGPPTKSAYEWRKVWADKRKYIRKKMQRKLKCQDVAGNSFSALEKDIIKICAMSESAERSTIKNAFGMSFDNKDLTISSDDLSSLSTIKREPTLKLEEVNLTMNNESDSVLQKEDALKDVGRHLEDLDESSRTSEKQQIKHTTREMLEINNKVQKELSCTISTAVTRMKLHQKVMEVNVKKIYQSIDLLLQETKRHNSEMEGLRRHEFETKVELKRRLIEIEEAKLKKLT